MALKRDRKNPNPRHSTPTVELRHNLDEIRKRHDALEELRGTLSVHSMTEKRSQAHIDRGRLLWILEQIVEKWEKGDI